MHDKTSYSNSNNTNSRQELKAYTEALIKAVLYDVEEIEEYLPELRRKVMSLGEDYAAFEHNLYRLIELYNNCKTKNKFSEPNTLVLKDLSKRLNVEYGIFKIGNSPEDITSYYKKKKVAKKTLIIVPILVSIIIVFYAFLNYYPYTTCDGEFWYGADKDKIGWAKNALGKYAIYDRFNKSRITGFVYDDCEIFYQGVARVVKKRKYGFVNKKGKLVIPCVYEYAHEFGDLYTAVKKDDKYFFIDKNNNRVFNNDYEWASFFSEGLAEIKVNGRVGFIDINGNIVINPIYEESNYPMGFDGGYYTTKLNGKFGIINKKGEVVIPFIYDKIENYWTSMSNECRVKKGNTWFCIDTLGNIIPCNE